MRSGLKFSCAAIAAFVCAGMTDAYSQTADAPVATTRATFFEPMFRVIAVTGDVRIFRPGAAEAVPVVNLHAYPYGSRIVVPKWDGRAKTPQASVSLSLTRDRRIDLLEGADAFVLDSEDNPAHRKVIDLRAGKMRAHITVSTVKPGNEEDAKIEAGIQALSFRLPNGITASRLTERNAITIRQKDGLTEILFEPESATMEITGPQFALNGIRRMSKIEIHGDKDYTRITNFSGAFNGVIEKGADEPEKVRFGERSMVKIWRTYASIGGKMAVSVMKVSPSGAISSYAYLEGEKASAAEQSADTGMESATADWADDQTGDTGDTGVGDASAPAATTGGFSDGFDLDW